MSTPQSFFKERGWVISLLRGEVLREKDLDWGVVLAVCEEERVGPIVYRAIARQETAVLPPSFKEQIKTTYLLNHFRNQGFLNELHELLALFRTENIPLIPLKGAALLLTALYEDPAERPMSDLDLLVNEAHTEKAHRLLLNRGYQVTGWEYWPWWRRFGGARTYEKDTTIIDLHWNLDGLGFRPSSDEIFSQAKPTAFFDIPSLILLPEDFLLYHLYHAVYHHAHLKLIWLVDVLKIITFWKEELPWERFWEKAAALNLTSEAGFGLKETKKIFPAHVPEAIIKEPISPPQNIVVNFRGEFERGESLLNLRRIPGGKNKLLFLLGATFPSPAYLQIRYHTKGRTGAWCYFLFRPLLIILKLLRELLHTVARGFSSPSFLG